MALEDYLEPEVAVTAVVTAAVFSPRARKLIRRGAVYGLAGILMAGDAIASFTRSVSQGVEDAGASASQAVQNAANQTKTATSTASPAQRRTSQTKASTEGGGGEA